MYLINTRSYKLKDFVSTLGVKYAILSHRWEDEETLFSDMADITSCDRAGVSKLRSFLKLARSLDYQWAWVDTCCIDKKSSAELSEAINSMFRWYRDSAVCIAYLSDVFVGKEDHRFTGTFCGSVWFTRCWTLQELLAPREVVFYNHDWIKIGERSTMTDLISEAAHLDHIALVPYVPLARHSVAERMSWASRRRATRVEDQAYSLLGLFGVTMPLLYGEGARAFERLQLEILSFEDDETLFAWQPASGMGDGGLLATSPHDFIDCGNHKSVNVEERTQPWAATSRGITTTLNLRPSRLGPNVYLAVLNAARRDTASESYIGIYLEREETSKDTYKRIFSRSSWKPITGQTDLWLGSYKSIRDLESSVTTIYIKQRMVRRPLPPLVSSVVLLPEELLKPPNHRSTRSHVPGGAHTPGISNQTASIALYQNTEIIPPQPGGQSVYHVKRSTGPGPICDIQLNGDWFGFLMIHLGIGDQLQPFLLIFTDQEELDIFREQVITPRSDALGTPLFIEPWWNRQRSNNLSFEYAKSNVTDFVQTIDDDERELAYSMSTKDWIYPEHYGMWSLIGDVNRKFSWDVTSNNGNSGFTIKLTPIPPSESLSVAADYVWRLDIWEHSDSHISSRAWDPDLDIRTSPSSLMTLD